MSWEGQGNPAARGYGWEWQKLRLRILRRDRYLCQACLREGRSIAACTVDHIRPKARGGTDDPANLQSLCADCTAEKDAIDRGRPLKPRRKIGSDGWPIR